MRKIWLSFALLAATLGYCFAAGDPITLTAYSTMGTGSACLLPPHNQSKVQAWGTNQTLAAGTVVHVGGTNYLVVSRIATAVTTNYPSATEGAVVSGDYAYRHVNNISVPRKGLAVYSIATNAVFLSFGQAAVAGKGIYLPASTGSLVLEGNVPQDALHVISATTGAVIYAQEW